MKSAGWTRDPPGRARAPLGTLGQSSAFSLHLEGSHIQVNHASAQSMRAPCRFTKGMSLCRWQNLSGRPSRRCLLVTSAQRCHGEIWIVAKLLTDMSGKHAHDHIDQLVAKLPVQLVLAESVGDLRKDLAAQLPDRPHVFFVSRGRRSHLTNSMIFRSRRHRELVSWNLSTISNDSAPVSMIKRPMFAAAPGEVGSVESSSTGWVGALANEVSAGNRTRAHRPTDGGPINPIRSGWWSRSQGTGPPHF